MFVSEYFGVFSLTPAVLLHIVLQAASSDVQKIIGLIKESQAGKGWLLFVS